MRSCHPERNEGSQRLPQPALGRRAREMNLGDPIKPPPLIRKIIVISRTSLFFTPYIASVKEDL